MVAEEEEGIVDQVDQVSSAQVINTLLCQLVLSSGQPNFTPSSGDWICPDPQSVSPAVVVTVVVNALLQVC